MYFTAVRGNNSMYELDHVGCVTQILYILSEFFFLLFEGM